ncbi:MAG: RluA family pseudouridine synthase [Cyclobacteriaceae bacterium]
MKVPFQVLYEDNHLLVVNKSSGILVQGDITGDVPLVDLCKVYVGRKYRKPGAVFLGVVHRIDRPVSGIVLLARTSKSLERMNALFRERETKKTYWAITENKPPLESGNLIHWLAKDEKRNKTTAYPRETAGASRSELSYQVIASIGNQWLLSVEPVTGRPHQIRAQLAFMGCPVKGDVKYGSSKPLEDGSIALHARKLEFMHPVKKEEIALKAPLPDTDWWRIFKKFNNDR